jgi:hypothetical protein
MSEDGSYAPHADGCKCILCERVARLAALVEGPNDLTVQAIREALVVPAPASEAPEKTDMVLALETLVGELAAEKARVERLKALYEVARSSAVKCANERDVARTELAGHRRREELSAARIAQLVRDLRHAHRLLTDCHAAKIPILNVEQAVCSVLFDKMAKPRRRASIEGTAPDGPFEYYALDPALEGHHAPAPERTTPEPPYAVLGDGSIEPLQNCHACGEMGKARFAHMHDCRAPAPATVWVVYRGDDHSRTVGAVRSTRELAEAAWRELRDAEIKRWREEFYCGPTTDTIIQGLQAERPCLEEMPLR